MNKCGMMVGGGGTVSACRTYITSPQVKLSSSKSSSCASQFSGGHRCHNRQHIRGTNKMSGELTILRISA